MNALRAKAIGFQDLFSVSSGDLQEQMVLETMKSMTTSLEELQRALKEMGTYPRKLVMRRMRLDGMVDKCSTVFAA